MTKPGKNPKKRVSRTNDQIYVPVSIFSGKLSGLEALVKYLKENKQLGLSEIARELNRDPATIWTTYGNACKKQKGRLREEGRRTITLEKFSDRTLSITETVIFYLKKTGLKYSEIATIINRDQRNIWSTYSRAKNKLKEQKIRGVEKPGLVAKTLSIPLRIFSGKLVGLEALVKYLKENKNLSLKEISELTKRKSTTIRTSYNNACKKQKKKFGKTKKNERVIPLRKFFQKRLTVTETIVLFLREKGLKYSEIAKLLNRDQRNIWTTYSRTKLKMEEENG